MTKIFLVRCASHEQAGTLLGRDDTVGLSRQGITEATATALRLAREGITRIQSSPRRRARETAALLAARAGLVVETVDALDDMDFGLWSGKPLIQLERDRSWSAWNGDRETERPPDGESFSDVQRRISSHLADTLMRYPGDVVAMITHAEPIRAAVLEQRGLPLSAWNQIELGPASFVEIGADAAATHYSAVA